MSGVTICLRFLELRNFWGCRNFSGKTGSFWKKSTVGDSNIEVPERKRSLHSIGY
jgi:hypothetical protein